MNLPSINVVEDPLGACFAVCSNKVLADPGDQMIFECALDELMKNVWCNHLVDVSTGEIICEWL